MRFKPLLFLFLITLLGFTACIHNKNKFTIIGNISNMPVQEVFLEEIGVNDVVTIVDSTKTTETGTFELSGTAPEPALYRLQFSQAKKFILLSVDKGNINVSGNWNTLENYDIGGSDASLSLKKFFVVAREHFRDFYTMGIVLDSLKAKGNDSVLALATNDLERMNNDYTRYIEKYADTTHYLPNAIFAAHVLNIHTEGDFLDAFTQSLDRRFPGTKLAKDWEAYYAQATGALSKPSAQPANVEVGEMAPDFTLSTPDGKQISLSSLKGKYVLLDFWASWCGPCRMENPNVVAAYNKFKDKNFTILSVSLDSKKEAWLKAINDDHLTWTHVSDLKGWESTPAVIYNIESIPSNFLLDPTGKIIDRDLRGDRLDEKLSSILK